MKKKLNELASKTQQAAESQNKNEEEKQRGGSDGFLF